MPEDRFSGDKILSNKSYLYVFLINHKNLYEKKFEKSKPSYKMNIRLCEDLVFATCFGREDLNF